MFIDKIVMCIVGVLMGSIGVNQLVWGNHTYDSVYVILIMMGFILGVPPILDIYTDYKTDYKIKKKFGGK